MAKWFKEFPINLRTGTDRAGKTGPVGTKAAGSKMSHSGGGVGSLLPGRHRKNSATELSRAGVSSWDNLRTKSRNNSKADPVLEEQSRATKSSPAANPFMNRLIRVDKPDKSPKFNTGTISSPPGPEPEKPVQTRTEPLIILEDYADPFDAQKTREQRAAERLDENDGYMEPYDAQQMITEIRRRGSKDLLKVCVVLEASEASPEDGQPSQIYDVPYEGGGGDKMMVTRPDLDPRPATEYELPWEWKKEHLVRTLSAQFDSAERQTKDEAPHPTLTRHLRHKSWTPKILRSSTSGTNPDTESCCVDPSLPLEQQSWYHGNVTRQEAEFQLQSCREASFLVRISESDTSKYSIALKTSQGCVHIIVAQTRGSGFTLDQSSCVFPSIPEVVHHYCTQRLPFNGAEHMTLLHPVPRVH